MPGGPRPRRPDADRAARRQRAPRWDAKLRAGLELVVPARKWKDDDDESIGSFVSRRLGSDVAERIAGPLLGGIFAGDAEALSVRACVPQLVEAEREHGSTRPRDARAQERSGTAQQREAGGEATAFVSLKRGVGDLVVNVAHKLRDAEVCDEPDRNACPFAGRATRAAAGSSRPTDGAHSRGRRRPRGARTRRRDAARRHSTPSSRAQCWRARVRVDGDGVPRVSQVRCPPSARRVRDSRSARENRPILACTFVSSKWDHRAPVGQILLRVFVGGAGHEDMRRPRRRRSRPGRARADPDRSGLTAPRCSRASSVSGTRARNRTSATLRACEDPRARRGASRPPHRR